MTYTYQLKWVKLDRTDGVKVFDSLPEAVD